MQCFYFPFTPSCPSSLNTSAWDSIVTHKCTLQELNVLIISHGIPVMKTYSMQEWVTVLVIISHGISVMAFVSENSHEYS
jgi:hypothetical protein